MKEWRVKKQFLAKKLYAPAIRDIRVGSRYSAGACSRRRFLSVAAGTVMVTAGKISEGKETREEVNSSTPFFKTRGVIVMKEDVATWPWLARAKEAGLNTVSLHVNPEDRKAFAESETGRAFVEECRSLGLGMEWEAHAVGALLPRELFAKDQTLFRMNDEGRRVVDANLCVSSTAAMELVSENAVNITRELPPATHRHFYWIDDAQPMCRCPKCTGLSDSDQALLMENAVLKALRHVDAKATLAHLCYQNTLKPPSQVKPEAGVFLEFAPIHRRYDAPLRCCDIPAHAAAQEALAGNLAVFGQAGAQALEYWLDVSRFSEWDRAKLTKIPWNNDVFLDDLDYYASCGICHVTTFACWIDGEYVRRFGDPPLQEYGRGLGRRR